MTASMTKLTADPDATQLGNHLADKKYLRQRTRPSYFDVDYLQLKDLHDMMVAMSPGFTGHVFDYGCGGAPYQKLFARCKSYIKADVTPGPVVDRVLAPDGLTTEPSESYDLVVSTQVLEH